MKNIVIVIPVCILFALVSCNKEDTYPNYQENEFLQFKVGNVWEFKNRKITIANKFIDNNLLYFTLVDSLPSGMKRTSFVRLTEKQAYYRDYSLEDSDTLIYLNNTEYVKFDFNKYQYETWYQRKYILKSDSVKYSLFTNFSMYDDSRLYLSPSEYLEELYYFMQYSAIDYPYDYYNYPQYNIYFEENTLARDIGFVFSAFKINESQKIVDTTNLIRTVKNGVETFYNR